MSSAEGTFQITLPSSASKNIFPQNQPNSFRVQLPRPLLLTPLENWEVGLVHVQFPQNWPNVIESTRLGLIVQFETDAFAEGAVKPRQTRRPPSVQDSDFEESMRDFMKPPRSSKEPFDGEKRLKAFYPFDIVTGHFDTITDLGLYICEQFREHVVFPWQSLISSNKENLKMDFIFDPLMKRARFLVSGPITASIVCTNNYVMHTLLGFESTWRETECGTRKPLHWYEVPSESKQPASLETLSSLYIYSDICKYQIVGDVEAPLLGIVPLQPVQGGQGGKGIGVAHQHFYSFNPPYYMGLAKDQITNIRIELKTEYGSAFPFDNDPNNSVCCRLHFRKGRGRQLPFLL